MIANYRRIIQDDGGSSWADVDGSHDADDADDDGYAAVLITGTGMACNADG